MAKHECTKETVFTKIFTTLEGLSNKTEFIRKAIEGNGKKGLVLKSQEANDFIIEMKEREKIEKWSRKKLLYWGIAGFTVVTGFFTTIIILYIKSKLGG